MPFQALWVALHSFHLPLTIQFKWHQVISNDASFPVLIESHPRWDPRSWFSKFAMFSKEVGREPGYLIDLLLKAMKNEGGKGKGWKERFMIWNAFCKLWVSIQDFQCLFATNTQSYLDIPWNSCCWQSLFSSLSFTMTVNYQVDLIGSIE